MSKYFTCPDCNETFEKILTDRECEEEKENNYPNIPYEDMILICSDCASREMLQ